jgi:hypothetical protein
MSTTNIQAFSGDVEIAGGLNITGTVTSTAGIDKVTLAEDTTDASRRVTFTTGSTGAQPLKTDAGLVYNPSTNQLTVGGTVTATTFSGALSNNLSPGSYLTGSAYNGSTARTFAVDATTTNTASKIVARDGDGDIFGRYLHGSYMNMSHGAGTNNSDTVFYSSTDNYIRKNTASGFRSSLNVPTRTGGDASGTWGISISGNADTVDGQHAHEMSWGHDIAHGTYSDFNSFINTDKFGAHFVTGNTNGPGQSGPTQYYHQRMALGSEYNQYSLQLAIGRGRSDNYLWYRNEENGSASSWYKMRAGYADSITYTQVAITAPNVTSGTWTDNNNTAAWGPPKFGTPYNQSCWNDNNGYRQWNIPSGMKSAYISQLTWSSGGYADVHGVLTDGSLVFLKRINTRQSIENSAHGTPHDGSTITFIGSGLDSFSAIRITNRLGRLHLTGLAFTQMLDGTDGTGMVHPQQLSTLLTASQVSGAVDGSANQVAIGNLAGQTSQGNTAVAVGYGAGQTSQAGYSVAIGRDAGNSSQQVHSVAVGRAAGQISQGTLAVAIGYNAGYNSQEEESVAIGYQAGYQNQRGLTVAIGRDTGHLRQNDQATALGSYSGRTDQGYRGIAIGHRPAYSSQGSYGIAIGYQAGYSSQPGNSFYVATNSVRNQGGTYYMRYNTSTGEVSYTSSDDRVKDGETLITDAVKTLSKLRPQNYFKRTKLDPNAPEQNWYHESGLMAQEVYYSVPEMRHLVMVPPEAGDIDNYTPPPSDDPSQDPDYSMWGDGIASVDYMQMVPYLVKGVQEIVIEVPRSKTTVSNTWGQNITGLVVSANTNKHKTNTVPIVNISTVSMDKSWYGVVSSEKTDSIEYDTLVDTKGDSRIWVTDTNGTLESGDLLTTSNVAPGYTQKQEGGALMNYTVAKVTQDCDFTEPLQVSIKIPKRELSNVMYYIHDESYEISLDEYEKRPSFKKSVEEIPIYFKEDVDGGETRYYQGDMEISSLKYDSLPGDAIKSVKQLREISVEEYNALDAVEKATYSLGTSKTYKAIQFSKSKKKIPQHDEVRILEELVDVLDENGQTVWEETGETKPVYTLVDHGTYKAALVSCKLI